MQLAGLAADGDAEFIDRGGGGGGGGSPRRSGGAAVGPSGGAFALNGAEGVATAFDDASGRFVVQLDGSRGRVKVRAAHLRMER